jgi:hypothetical protein
VRTSFSGSEMKLTIDNLQQALESFCKMACSRIRATLRHLIDAAPTGQTSQEQFMLEL